MAIGDYCTRDVCTVERSDTLREAARKLGEAGVGCLVVLDGAAVAGVVTDRDLALSTLARGHDPDATGVGELVAERAAVVVHEDSSLGVAAGMMRRHAIRRLPVLDADERLVGLIASDDLMRMVSRELSGLARAIGAQTPQTSHEVSVGSAAAPEVE